jgi:AAHS family 4-hydroxybenzoate transporter-like MFS transporter
LAPTTLEQEVSDRLDAGAIGGVQFRILGLCLLLAVLDGYDLASMGLAVPLMARDWGIAPGEFGAPLAAVWIGVAAGSMLLGWLGDRIGRKPVVVASAFAVGVLSLAVISSHNITILTVWRFLLGMAFGAGLPNIFALVADVVPSRRRMFCITLLTAATSIGGIAGGLAAPALSGLFGWEGIFLAGGLIPLAISVLMVFLLLESPRVLAARNRLGELASVLAALGLNSSNLPEARANATVVKSRPTDLLRSGLFLVSAFYLIGWIFSGFTYYMLANWLPTLLTNSGWSSGAAQRSVTFLYAGSMAGGLFLSWLIDRWPRGGLGVQAGAYAVGALLFVAAGYLFESSLLSVILAALGIAIGGGQYVLPAMATRLYPPALLATSFSWIGALARIGGIAGSIVGGWMLLSGWSAARIVTVLSLAPLLSTIAFAALAITAARRSDAAKLQKTKSVP